MDSGHGCQKDGNGYRETEGEQSFQGGVWFVNKRRGELNKMNKVY